MAVVVAFLIPQPDWDKYHFIPQPDWDKYHTAALAAALDSGTLPALVMLQLNDIPASAAAIDAVTEAVYS